MTQEPQPFRRRYRDALAWYLDGQGEDALSAAYDLGRVAVRQSLNVLDLASTHHATLLEMTTSPPPGLQAATAVRAGGEFFLEALSAFEMVQRVLRDARETAQLERRQAKVLRRLSSFLGDTSLALDGASSLGEMLQLVAEHARELLGAQRCVARLRLDGGNGEPVVAVAEGGSPEGREAQGEADLEALYTAIAPPDGTVRMTSAELAHHPARLALAPSDALQVPSGGWLAASLRALDGRRMGLMQLFGKRKGEFSELDAALLVQLAQMSSAAVERAQLYSR